MGWVKLHPHNIAQKVALIVEHYRELVAPLLAGRAKAMVVVSSRREAVRWQLAITKYIKGKGYNIGALVAFSGEVNDPESGSEGFTETSKSLNPGLRGRDIRTAFDTPEFQILLVANKFQTGFDQKLLCGMYVDKRLAGIQAVQTLSRLNRAAPGKDTTYIVDFANEAGDVLKAFQTYYEGAALTATTDPNLVYTLRSKLDEAGHYDEFEIERAVNAHLANKTQSELSAAVTPVASRVCHKFSEAKQALAEAKAARNEDAAAAATETMDALQLFKADLGSYVRLYTFLSQIFDYGDTAFEKRNIFYRLLLPLLEFGRERETIDLSQLMLTHHLLRNQGKATMKLGGPGERPKLDPLRAVGSGSIREKEKALLEEIIAGLNDIFGEDTNSDDQLVVMEHVRGHLLRSDTLREQAANNSKEQFINSPDLSSEQTNAVINAMDAHAALSALLLNSPERAAKLLALLIDKGQLYELLRGETAAAPA
jgi:type I restriction enzyme R subunit